MQIPDKTENNSLEELEIMKKSNLYFSKSKILCQGGIKKQPEKNILRECVKLDSSLKLRIGEGQ